MATAIEQLPSLKSPEEVRTTLLSVEAKLAEAREETSADSREESSTYDADKEQMVEALDAMVTDTISKELKESQKTKQVQYQSWITTKEMVEHAKLDQPQWKL